MTPREIDKKLGEAVEKAQVKFLNQIVRINKNNTYKGDKNESNNRRKGSSL